MADEIEIKLRVECIEDVLERLRDLGFRLHRERGLETNGVFDTPDLDIGKHGQLIRLRRWAGKGILTYKGPPLAGKHKRREEIELDVSDGEKLGTILERLGYHRVFRYEKYRTEYEQPGENGLVTMDETPIGNFLEIEGAPNWIDATARGLGYAERDYITTSYGALYIEYRREHPDAPRDMIFPGT